MRYKGLALLCAMMVAVSGVFVPVLKAADSGAVSEGLQVFAGKKVFLDNTPIATTATGAITLYKDSKRVQLIDANGSSRNVTLPDETITQGYEFYISNSSSTAVNLAIKGSAGGAIATVGQYQSGIFWCNGTTWYGSVFTSATTGFVAADGTTTGATGQTQVFTNGVTADTFIGNTAAPVTLTGKIGSSAVGNAVTITGGAGGGANNGGAVNVAGGASGAGGATGAGGAVNITGAASVATNGAGGAVITIAGAGVGSGAGGLTSLLSGAGGATGAGGVSTMTAGRGGSTSGAAGTVTITAGAGGASSTVTGGVTAIVGGASGSGATGNGGDVQVTGGAGVSTDGNGGSILLTPGAKNGTAIAGGVFLRSSTSQIFKQQTAAGAGADQAEVLTAAMMINGIFVHTVSTGRTLTTPTGAAITSGCPASVATGDSFDFTVITIGAGADDISTLTAGDGNVTFVGDVTIGPVTTTTRSSGTWRFRKTGASTWVGYRLN